MFKVMGVAVALLLLSNAVTGFLLKTSYEDNGILKANVATAEQAVADQKARAEEQRALYEAEQQRTLEASAAANAAVAARDEAVNDLRNFRDRLGAAGIARPGLVGRLATRATRDVMCEFAEETGGDPCQ